LIDPSRIGVFSSDGRFVRAFGRRGRGPGEFDEIKDLQLGRGDTLYVLHDERISVYSPGTFEQVRTASSRAARMARYLALLSDGGIVTARSSTTALAPAEDLIWLHRAEATSPIPAGMTTTDTASAALFVRNDTIWLLRHDYTLFRKTPSGVWTLLTERPLWYAQDHHAAAREDRGGARVNDLLVDADGRVWVLSYVFAKPPRRPQSGGEQQERPVATSMWQSSTQPRLDCWEPDGTLYLSVELADGVAGFADPHHVLHIAEDASGNDIVSVRRLRVAR
jgi:hypothetical protein